MDLEPHIKHLHGPEEITYAPDELVVACLVRDGRPYLKSFVEHYFSLGVKHIVFMDNGSTDGTVEALKGYDNVTILQTELPFKEYKNPLRRYLVTRFGRDRWILYVDIDELFDYPYSDVASLGSFLKYLTRNSYTAVVAQMLDMFPEGPVSKAANVKDEPLKERHRFYDVSDIAEQGYYTRGDASNAVASEEIEVYRNGIRKTVFEQYGLLTKHPLMFIDGEIRHMDPGPHWVSGARVADITCVLFHYMFIGDFYEKTLRAVKEESYANDSAKYKKFFEVLERNPELRIKRETARELRGVNDLVDDQFLVVSGDYVAWVDAEERKSASGNGALEGGEPRRLVEAFSKASARARTKARVAKVLEHQVRRLRRNLAEERGKAKNGPTEELQKVNALRRRNLDLERQIQDIQGSRSWKLLGKLVRIRAKISGRR